MRFDVLPGSAPRKANTFLLLAGAVILAGFLRSFFASRTSRHRNTRKFNSLRLRTDYFSIRQTRSELGYVYWVLQGHGKFTSFALFDTWREAMDAAHQRISEAVPDSQLIFQHTH